MADNSYKRAMANRALMILNAGRTTAGGVLFDSIDDTEFADYTTVDEGSDGDKRLVCFVYESVLKQVLEDMVPQFARRYADLSYPYAVNQEFGGWEYLFELPSDFLCLVAQVDEGNPLAEAVVDRDPQILHFASYAHTVVGTDDNVYYCSTDHTSVDDSSDGQPPDDDGNANWTVDSTELLEGATWVEGLAYQSAGTGLLLASNTLNNDTGTGAYIEYVAYVRAGRSDQPQYYPASFQNAFATRLAAEMAIDGKDFERRQALLKEYEGLAKPAAAAAANRHRVRVRRYTIFEKRTHY